KCKGMGEAPAVGNSRNLFRLIRSTGPRKPGVSEVIKEADGSVIHSQERRLDRWAEHFRDQFSWTTSTTDMGNVATNATFEVDISPPSEREVNRELGYLKRNKAAGPDGLFPSVFKDGGPALVTELTGLLRTVWDRSEIPKDWCESVIIPIYKKGDRSSCENHRGISLVSIASKLLAGIILRRLSSAREQTTRENQAGFRPGRGCVDHIFTLRQILEHRHTFRRPTISVFLDLKAAFDSVDRTVLWRCLSVKGVPEKFISLIQSLYQNSRSRVRAYGELSPEFTTTSGVRQGCPLSPFLFNFVIDMILEIALSSCENSGIQLFPGGSVLSDLEYADDVVLLSEDAGKLQAFLDGLNYSVGVFGMRFAPSKCKMLLHDWVGPAPNLILAGEVIERVDKFCYLGSLISADGSISDEVSARIQRARLAFANLSHLWRRRDVRLSVKGRVYAAAVRPVLLYGSETWPLRAEDSRRLSVFDHRCLRSIARVWWDHQISNAEVRRRVLGREGRAIDQVLNLHRLRWLGHVLRMSPDRLPQRALLAESGSGWKKVRGGQSMTWQKGMKTLTSGLARVGHVRLPGWGPQDRPTVWLETLASMAQCRSQWRACIHNLSSST
ncbi:reverse transcriptase family protein, partial [Streptococcus dysgalactiae subsp. equisimilis]|nr:reverse transcriptase family protein [Streptococcus dysgalactiae subsp. equisimilis]